MVLMVATTQPEDIAQYAWRVGDKWKIGRKGVGDGVLIVVAKDDRRMRIEVAKALEGLLPDTALTRITDSAMKPRFRANDYAGGLNAAVDQITARLAGDELPAVGASGQQSAGAQDDDDGAFVVELFVVFFLAPFLGKRLLCNRLGRKKGVAITTGLMAAGSYLYSMDNVIVVLSSLMTMIVLLIITGKAGTGSGGGSGSSGGWTSSSDWSSSSSSSNSGGFSSGGGGDFGGGGASDDW